MPIVPPSGQHEEYIFFFSRGKPKITSLGDSKGWDGWMESPTQGIQVWANSRRSWRTGELGVLQSTGSKRNGYDLAAGQQQSFRGLANISWVLSMSYSQWITYHEYNSLILEVSGLFIEKITLIYLLKYLAIYFTFNKYCILGTVLHLQKLSKVIQEFMYTPHPASS